MSDPKPIEVSKVKRNMIVAYSTPYTKKLILRATKIHPTAVAFDYDSLDKGGYAGELKEGNKGLYKVNSVSDGDKLNW